MILEGAALPSFGPEIRSSEAHLRDLTPGQHSSEETSQRRQGVGDNASDATTQGIEALTFRTVSDVLSHYGNQSVVSHILHTHLILSIHF